MQIAVEFSLFGVSQRTRLCLCRKFINPITVSVGELHREQISGNIRSNLSRVRFDDASQNRRLTILCKDLGTHTSSTTLSSHISAESRVRFKVLAAPRTGSPPSSPSPIADD